MDDDRYASIIQEAHLSGKQIDKASLKLQLMIEL